MSPHPKPSETGGAPAVFWVGLLLIALFTALLWAPGQKGFFALDDFVFLEAYAPGSALSSPASWLTAVSPVDNAYRPLTTSAYFSLSRRAFGLNPWGYHLVSLLIHGLTTLLVAGLCWGVTRNGTAALMGGLFYATRSSLWVAVRWSSGVQDLGLALGAALAALGLVLYVRRGGILGLATCIAGVVVALGSKEAGLALVPALVALAVAASPGGWLRRTALALVPASALAAIYLAWRVALTWTYPTIHKTSTNPLHLARRFAGFFLSSLTGASSSPTWGAVALGVSAVVLLGLYRLRAQRTSEGQPPPAWGRAIAAGLVFFTVTLIPTLVITQEPHQYYLAMPLVGMSLAVAGASAGLVEAQEARSRLAVAALVALLVGAPLVQGLREVRAKDAGELASGGFYHSGDGAIYQRAWRGVSGLWEALPEGATLLMVGYPYDGLISANVRGRGLEPTSTMGAMFRAFYGLRDLSFAHVVAEASQVGTMSPTVAFEQVEAEPDTTFVALYSQGSFEALPAEEAKELLATLSKERPAR